MKRTLVLAVLITALLVALAGCRNETQNRIRRSIQDFTNQRMYITLYSYDGKVVFNGVVDGKVTRSSTASEGTGSGSSQGYYIYWYDDRGRYHQSDLPYLLTTYDRSKPAAQSQQPSTAP
ncbi:MAG: hypothetical protein P8Y02_07425 [Deinococcales bacterium]